VVPEEMIFLRGGGSGIHPRNEFRGFIAAETKRGIIPLYSFGIGAII
jgi:hypothetical protein